MRAMSENPDVVRFTDGAIEGGPERERIGGQHIEPRPAAATFARDRLRPTPGHAQQVADKTGPVACAPDGGP